VEGERAFAHIQLGDTYRTVSRMQAEIIQQDQTILLKNTSETNPTMVNGDQVPAGRRRLSGPVRPAHQVGVQ